jgi:alkanesulfonate monooxygenase SsuD/methylene tetrahydromethanopterin reductase-like flavin-dependent oxidoreductase (luciferase family)
VDHLATEPAQESGIKKECVAMRFDSGILNHCGDVANYPRIEEWKQSALLLEELGFTAIWTAEHHFFWDGWTNPVPTNPILFGAFIAGQTTRLKLAQCGVCVPDWHPIRAAEDVAMLDHMSKGRVEFGALRGVNNRVNGNFNPKADRRDQKTSQALYWESLDIIQLAWKGEPFSYKGKFYTFPMPGWFDERTPLDRLDPRFFTREGELTHLQLVPTPFQKPSPPIWVMAESESSNAEVGRRGLGVLSYAQSFEQTRAAWTAYREARAATGSPNKERLAVMRPIFVAPTQAEAEAVMRPAINRLMAHGVRRDIDQSRARRGFLAKHEPFDESELQLDWFDFLVRRGHVHVGTPEYVVDRLKRFQEELGCEHFVLHWAVPLVTFEQYRASLRLFAEKVMPKF